MQGQAFRLEGIFSHEDRFFEETKAFYAETDLLSILGVNIIHGEKSGALDRPGTVILSQSAARKYFNDEPPIGKTMYYNNNVLLEVVGVFADIPANSHFKADIFVSLEAWKQQNPNLFQQGYIYSGFYNYIKLREGTDPRTVTQLTAEYVEREYGEALSSGQIEMGFQLFPLQDIHLHSHLMHELELNGNAASIGFLEIIAWFILIIAWVNFFNLSTITAIRRLREITIRKVNGASRLQLILQLLTESAIINLFAIFVALLLFESLSPIFFNFADLPRDIPVWNQQWVFGLLLFAFVVGTLSAGIYSVTGIPSSKLTELLKGIPMTFGGKRTMRKILLTIQFVIAIGLIAGTISIFRQYTLISKKSPGFRMENMVVVNAPLMTDSISLVKFATLKKELSQIPEISGASFSSVIPGKPNMYNRGGVYLYGEDHTSGKNFRVTETDENFLKVYGIRVLEGEDFTGMAGIDQQRIMLNAYGAQWIGFDTIKNAVGEKIVLENEVFTIAGIVDDFHQLSPREAIEPQIFKIPRRHRGYLTMALNTDDHTVAVEKIQQMYSSYFPANPFGYFLLKDYYSSQNLGEKRFGVVFLLFSVLVILITILGLMGLSAYTAEQKRKEIGIRKVLGANPLDIFRLLFKDYIYLWIIGALIALPTAYLLLEKWLDSYAVRIVPDYLFYILPLILVILVALTTVFMQSFKILKMNPVDNIRTE
jgi:putative ABC transport system permease protein